MTVLEVQRMCNSMRSRMLEKR